MSYSENHGYQWWGQLRTASRTLMRIQEALGFLDMNTHNCKVYNPDWNTVISIRNPYARAISFWILRHGLESHDQERISFEEYLESENEYFSIKGPMAWNPIYRLKELNGKIYTIRNENIVEDLLNIPIVSDNLNILKNEIETIKTNRWTYRKSYLLEKDKPYYELYTPELADIVYETKKEEFETWGYEKDSWKTLVI
jgi:hypothetical protein